MKVVILYRKYGASTMAVDEFVREYKNRYPNHDLELVDVDEMKGDEMAKLYDVVSYPAVLVVQTDGNLQEMWQGEEMPLIDNVAGFVAN